MKPLKKELTEDAKKFNAPEHFGEALEAFIADQKPLGPEFEQVWDENTDRLYEAMPVKKKKARRAKAKRRTL